MFSLHQTEVNFGQNFSTKVQAVLIGINTSDDLSFLYIANEALAVATLSITGIVAYAHWQLQRKADVVVVLIHQCEHHIAELRNDNDFLVDENSSLEIYIASLNETQELIYCRYVKNVKRYHRMEKLYRECEDLQHGRMLLRTTHPTLVMPRHGSRDWQSYVESLIEEDINKAIQASQEGQAAQTKQQSLRLVDI